MALTRETVYAFLKAHGLSVMSTVAPDGSPEAALVNYGVTPDLELVFETLQTSRKWANIRRNPRIALVTGWAGADKKTLQYEGVVYQPDEFALAPLLEVYFAACPDARAHRGWPGLIYARVRPKWIRLSDYGEPWSVDEWTAK